VDDQFAFMSKLNKIAQDAGFVDSGGDVGYLTSLLSRVSMEQALGTTDARFADLMWGLNRRQQGNAVPTNTDIQGLTFFTRPNLNLSYDNLGQVRQLTHLLSRAENTYQRAIRLLLSPDLTSDSGLVSPGLVDSNMPFIPLLSNTLISCTGWPDLVANAYISQEGVAKETWMMNDSNVRINGHYTLNCNFQNIKGDPITTLFHAWLIYMGAVYVGEMVPWPYCIVENEIDYMTRVYRLVLDVTGTYVQKWACCGVAMPSSLNIGASFNYSRDNPMTDEVNQISMSFDCVGAIYNDPLVLEEFNSAVYKFNPQMEDASRSSYFQKLTPAERPLFNYTGYPRINETTQELEWWVHKDLYREYTSLNTSMVTAQGIIDYNRNRAATDKNGTRILETTIPNETDTWRNQ